MDQQVDLSRGGRDAFFEHLMPEQRIDERAFSGIELADDHEQEELVELTHRRVEGRLIRRSGAEIRQRLPDGGQQVSRLRELIGERRLKNAKHVKKKRKTDADTARTPELSR